MRLTKLSLSVMAALGLSTGAAFAGGDSDPSHQSSAPMTPQTVTPETLSEAQPMDSLEAPLSHQSDPMGYQPYSYSSYEQGGPDLLSEAQPMTSQEEYSMQSPEYSAQSPEAQSPEEYFAQGPESEAYEPPVLGNELG